MRASTSALKSEYSAGSDGSGEADHARRPRPPPDAQYPDNLGAGTPRAAVRRNFLGRELDILAGTPVAAAAPTPTAPILGPASRLSEPAAVSDAHRSSQGPAARTELTGAAVALLASHVHSAADDTESTTNNGGGAIADPSPPPARSTNDSSVTLGRTSPSSSAAGSRALPASARPAGAASRDPMAPAEQDRALLHGLAWTLSTLRLWEGRRWLSGILLGCLMR